MKIEKINFDNFDMLYEACQLNTTSNRVNFGNNFIKLLQHLNVHMKISDINIFEAYLLKHYVAEYNEISTYTRISSESGSEEYNVFSGMESLLKEMNNDTDIEDKPGFMLMPVDYINKNVYVRFTGSSIINILNGTPEAFFMRLRFIQDYKKSKNVFPDRLWYDKNTIEEISNQLISGFYVSFYQYAMDYLKSADIKTDSSLMTHSYSYVSPIKRITLSNVSTPVGGIRFVNNDQNINNEIKTIKDGFNESSEIDKLSNITMYFTVYSSLYTFLELSLALPNELFIDNMDFKIPLSYQTDLISYSTSNKYNIRLNTKTKNIITNLDNFVKDEKERLFSEKNTNGTPNLLLRLSKLPLNTSISYSIKIRLSDCNDVIQPYLEDLENGIYGKNTYLSKEIESILNEINKLGINIYKLIL